MAYICHLGYGVTAIQGIVDGGIAVVAADGYVFCRIVKCRDAGCGSVVVVVEIEFLLVAIEPSVAFHVAAYVARTTHLYGVGIELPVIIPVGTIIELIVYPCLGETLYLWCLHGQSEFECRAIEVRCRVGHLHIVSGECTLKRVFKVLGHGNSAYGIVVSEDEGFGVKMIVVDDYFLAVAGIVYLRFGCRTANLEFVVH